MMNQAEQVYVCFTKPLSNCCNGDKAEKNWGRTS